jgi:glutathione synthase/RimK-type ligase-like ATP-grasp enzyme
MKIAILTCEQLPELNVNDQDLIPELAKHNVTATAVIWDDPSVNWIDYDYLIFRNTWDYYEKELAFNNWLDKIEKLGIKTLNAIEVIKKNKHKFYLRKMEEQGVTIVPTVFIAKTTALDLKQLLPKHWKKAVLKPAFSAGSYQTSVFDVKDSDAITEHYKLIASQKELLLQEFMPEIQTKGETSFIFFNKIFSHAVNKMPVKGDFRIQVQYGGKYKLIHPSLELIAAAQKIVDNYAKELLYARVDGIVIDNKIHLMEVECIEPDLYLNLSEGAVQRFSQAIIASLN